MEILIIIFAVLLGLVVGSFLNVAAFRMMADTSIVFGRSHCQMCGMFLRARDLIPVFSYIWLRGKCRDCKQSISKQYPLVEAATAIVFGLVATSHLYGVAGFDGWVLARDLVFSAALIVLFVFDKRWLVLPDQITLPLIVFAIIANLMLGINAISLLVGALVGGGLYFGLWAISRGRWVGSGDMRMGAAMGFMLGWPGVLVALYLAYLIGGVVAVVMLASGHRRWGNVLPMGTFLAIGTIAVLLLQQIYPDWILLLTF